MRIYSCNSQASAGDLEAIDGVLDEMEKDDLPPEGPNTPISPCNSTVTHSTLDDDDDDDDDDGGDDDDDDDDDDGRGRRRRTTRTIPPP